ncbi:histone-like nucleoid-structuring protein Lsr2 [Streptomyces sp. NPDC007251]|uniref:Lsr2 family DNA-binding protein n=1 Tax=Streptomyces sp. NPDC007251 TaxID=3154483 RepID=UPI0033F1F4EC
MTSIDQLTRLCPPPADPPPVDWNAVEATLGFRLPQDYKQLAALYGPGAFAGFIRVFHPRGVTEWVNLTGPVPTAMREQLQSDQAAGLPVPHDPQSLFAMAVTDNGDHLFWIMEPGDDPDAWHIAVNEARGPQWSTFEGNLTELLVSVLNGETDIPQFPNGLRHAATTFIPSAPGVSATSPMATPAPTDTNIIREWARANGYDLPPRGRVPAAIIDAWIQANSGAQ